MKKDLTDLKKIVLEMVSQSGEIDLDNDQTSMIIVFTLIFKLLQQLQKYYPHQEKIVLIMTTKANQMIRLMRSM